VIVRRKLKRRYVLLFFQKLALCVAGVEACTSSHHWSRELKALWANTFNKLNPHTWSPAPHATRVP